MFTELKNQNDRLRRDSVDKSSCLTRAQSSRFSPNHLVNQVLCGMPVAPGLRG